MRSRQHREPPVDFPRSAQHRCASAGYRVRRCCDDREIARAKWHTQNGRLPPPDRSVRRRPVRHRRELMQTCRWRRGRTSRHRNATPRFRRSLAPPDDSLFPDRSPRAARQNGCFAGRCRQKSLLSLHPHCDSDHSRRRPTRRVRSARHGFRSSTRLRIGSRATGYNSLPRRSDCRPS